MSIVLQCMITFYMRGRFLAFVTSIFDLPVK